MTRLWFHVAMTKIPRSDIEFATNGIIFEIIKLLKNRTTLLKSIDFVWDGREAKANKKWMSLYQRLVSYKEEHHGSTSVPQNYDADPQLANWVNTQRAFLKNNKLPADRVSRTRQIYRFCTGWKFR